MAGEVVNTGGMREMGENTRVALNALRLEFDDVDTNLGTAEGDIDTLEGRMDTAEEDIGTLEDSMGTAEEDIGALETAVEAVDTQRVISTDEVDTGWKWVGGSTIYRKALAVAAYPNAGSANVAHGITGLGTVVRLFGVADNGTTQYVLNSPDGTGDFSACVDDTNVVVSAAADLSGYAGHVVIEYTKTS